MTEGNDTHKFEEISPMSHVGIFMLDLPRYVNIKHYITCTEKLKYTF